MKNLIVLLGPTGVGKTDLSIHLARSLRTSIISCDSRQCYKEMKIGTAVPSEEELAAVPHFFIQHLSVCDYFSAWQFAEDAERLILKLHESVDSVVMAGGSMMYIDALCKGIDPIPTISERVRSEVQQMRGLPNGDESLRAELLRRDPVFYGEVDLNNMKRVAHAVEICREVGAPYSSLRRQRVAEHPYRIVRIGLTRPREELYARIDRRVEVMMEMGLEDEARRLLPLRTYNSLNTVGYKEMFDYFDGKIDLPEAVRQIKRNSRHYAKKQMTWFKRDADIAWFHPDATLEIKRYLEGLEIGF